MPFVDHPECSLKLEEDKQIWRYVDLAKLLFLLQNESLLFLRGDRFNDPFEGSLDALEWLYRQVSNNSLSNPALAIHVESSLSETNIKMRKFVWLNCWHANPFESAAMWPIYGGRDAGIAIVSTTDRLVRALRPSDQNVEIGSVQYGVQQRSPQARLRTSIRERFLRKREPYRYEQEIRAMIVSEHVTDAAVVISTEPPVSQNVRVNLADLFDRVVLAPGTSQWVVDVVTRCIRDAGVGCPVEPSTLDQPPKF